MDPDKKKHLLIVPLIFMVLLHVPVMVDEIAYECMNANILESPEVIKCLYLGMLYISVVIWGSLFYYIPIGVYVAILVVYTVVSWRWILRRKKGNAMYFIVWLVLCVLSILLYWKFEPEYYIMLNG